MQIQEKTFPVQLLPLRLFTWATAASLFILLASINTGCSSKTASESPSPSASVPSSSPSTSTITNEKTNTATPDSSQGEGKFVEVKIDKLDTYSHPDGLFTMDIPTGWTKQDTSKPDEVIIAWTDPARNSLIIMDIFEIEANPSKEELGNTLKEFITGLFGTQPKFEVSDAQEQPDGTMRIEWSYEVTVGGKSGILLGNSFIEQKSDKVAVFSVALPKGQFDGLKENVNQIIASRKINPDVKIAK